MPGQGTLTSLLNRTIQRGETTLDSSLESFLAALADGSYRVGKGSLTLTTTAPVIDTISGDWDTDQAQLTATAWWTGQETASQALIDQVTGLHQIGVAFAFDSDTTTTTTTTPGSYTSVSGAFYLQSGLNTTAWYGNATAAAAAAEDLKVTGLAFVTAGSNAGVTYKAWDGTQVQTYQVASSFTGPYAKTYTASTSSTTTTTTVDALVWDGSTVQLQTFAAAEFGTFAIDVTDGYRTAVWDTNKKPLLGMDLTWAGGGSHLTIV
jgi:hypothetical protein